MTDHETQWDRLLKIITIGRVLGPEVTLLEGGDGTARETRRRLAGADLLEEGEGEIRILNSSENKDMIRLSWERLDQER